MQTRTTFTQKTASLKLGPSAKHCPSMGTQSLLPLCFISGIEMFISFWYPIHAKVNSNQWRTHCPVLISALQWATSIHVEQPSTNYFDLIKLHYIALLPALHKAIWFALIEVLTLLASFPCSEMIILLSFIIPSRAASWHRMKARHTKAKRVILSKI